MNTYLHQVNMYMRVGILLDSSNAILLFTSKSEWKITRSLLCSRTVQRRWCHFGEWTKSFLLLIQEISPLSQIWRTNTCGWKTGHIGINVIQIIFMVWSHVNLNWLSDHAEIAGGIWLCPTVMEMRYVHLLSNYVNQQTVNMLSIM